MTAITTPYSLELTADEDAREAVVGAVVTVVAGKLKIFLGAAVTPEKMQSIVGSLKACYRVAMNRVLKRGVAADVVAFGNFLSATAGSITLAADTVGVGTTDVAVVISQTFGSSGGFAQTHMDTETFDQLINVLLENSSDT